MKLLVLLLLVRVGACEHDDEEPHHHAHVNNDNEHHTKLYTQNHQAHQQPSTTSRVLELSDRFLEIVNNNGGGNLPRYQPWLVMFYAPWCGHCKRLEPVFNHVAQALHNTPIRVGRVDCTRFPSVGQEFKIHGYPTIMFISGPTHRSTFQGDREVNNIVKFAKRMNAPAITKSSLPLEKFLSTHTTSLPPLHDQNPARFKREDHPMTSPPDYSHFFGMLRPPGYRDELTDAYATLASKYQQWNEFYEFEGEITSVFVYKHGRLVVFKPEQGNVSSQLESWVGKEKHLDFIHLTRGNLWSLFMEGKDYLVVGVVHEDKLDRIVEEEERRLVSLLKQLTNTVIQQSLTTPVIPNTKSTVLPLNLHYAWIGSPDLANSLVAETLPLPTLLIIHKSNVSQDHKYYVFSDPAQFSTESKIQNIVELVMDNHFTPTVHANSWTFKAYRYLFDARVSLADMWAGNPVLTVVLFGLPLGFLSLILYSVCCGDIMDANEDEVDYDDDEQDNNHKKRE